MKITSFDTGLYSVPLTESWGSSNYSFTSLEFVVVWLHTDTGHTGTGWTFSVGNGGSAFKSLIDHYLAPKVVGKDPLQIERLWNATQHYRRAFTRLLDVERNRIVHDEHHMLVAAIRENDPDEAERVLFGHIRRTRLQLTRHPEVFS